MGIDSSRSTPVRVPESLYGQLRVIAAAHERSISAEVRVALDAYVRHELPKVKREAKR